MVILMLSASVSAAGKAASSAAPLSTLILRIDDEFGALASRIEFYMLGCEAIMRENIDDIEDWSCMITVGCDLKQFMFTVESFIREAHEAAKAEAAR